ncbi:uncharacterized protein LOC142333905 [Lycorma delicatula]|uniref:uncharacterized protein LOC142333905 n=1 Tax=Lycorma delicatula TaxID=130591 RepID=UPI003F5125D2
MWSSVAPSNEDDIAPPSRSKHSVTLLGSHLYLLGGRNGNLPLKDLWRYNLADGKWQLLRPSGETPPCLQEHSAVAYKDCLYVFGGELGFSAGNETPLWVYHVKTNTWRKVRAQKGVASPRGRRGHSALAHRGAMLLYGGYRDLRGSSNELWAFHFESESWHLISSGNSCPPARHKHSAVVHDDSMWIYGGMTDLHERADLWRFDTVTKTWTSVKTKVNPGSLHSHAVCKLPSSMLVFGGEHDGQPTNELWRFHFGTESWERLQTQGLKPQPRSESVALTVSELLLQDNSNRTSPPITRRYRGGGSVDRHNRASPADRKYYRWSSGGSCTNYDGCTPSRKQPITPNSSNLSILKEISKLSQMNISRLGSNNKCNYSVLSSTESIASDSSSATNEMTKSQSVNVITANKNVMTPSSCITPLTNAPSNLTRDPISVPNFTSISSSCTLTPVEVTKLVYLDNEEAPIPGPTKNQDFSSIHQQFQPINNVNSSINNKSKKGFPKSASVRFGNPYVTPEEPSDETSDYASIETMNRLSSNYSFDNSKLIIKSLTNNKDLPLSFSNPNYMGPDIQTILSRKDYVKVLNSPPDSLLEDALGRSNSRQDMVEMKPMPPRSLSLNNSNNDNYYKTSNCYNDNMAVEKRKLKNRASSASRADREPITSLCIFLIGGKEHGQVTVFKRPLSVWKLILNTEIY